MVTITDARSWYSQDDPVHGFDHIVRVYQLADKIGRSENADLEIVHAAVLLHDARDSLTQGGEVGRLNHQHTSAFFAEQVLASAGWQEGRIQSVLHCIRAHRFRDQSESPHTIEAMVMFDADKLDAIGAVGVARAIAYSIVAGSPIYAEPSRYFLETGKTETGESHSAYHEFIYKLSKIKSLLYTSTAMAIAEDRHQLMVAYFTQLAAEYHGSK
jgi:uncharacterized protein